MGAKRRGKRKEERIALNGTNFGDTSTPVALCVGFSNAGLARHEDLV